MSVAQIVWVDDEIDLLKSQQIFLEKKGYEIVTFTNGYDAIEYLKTTLPDVVFLDESMPGMNGLEALVQIKEMYNNLPVVMITKNETEALMEEVIGSQIADYLIKPVNPNQVLHSLKKILDNNRLFAEKTTSAYQQDFRHLFMALNDNPNYEEWVELYKKLVFWELEIEKSGSAEMLEILQSQKTEANANFFKYISNNYADWVQPNAKDTPTLSHKLLESKVLPSIEKGEPVFFILIDNLRYDMWKIIQPLLEAQFKIEKEDAYYSILPTATQYCRNAIFAGMMPADIRKKYPNIWMNDDEDGSKNADEEFLFESFLKKTNKSHLKWNYVKVANAQDSQSLYSNIQNYLQQDLTIIVYNFLDMMSHARTEMEVLKEMAKDEVGFRSMVWSWFRNSALFQAFQKLEGKKFKIILTTDHGSVRVQKAVKVVGDRQTTTNLRYKLGRSLDYNPKDVLAFRNPGEIGLPSPNVNSSFVFAKEDTFLCYPQNYNYYASYYKNSFQHGGVSLEEMIVPIITMITK